MTNESLFLFLAVNFSRNPFIFLLIITRFTTKKKNGQTFYGIVCN
jgi:hypothetical protein